MKKVLICDDSEFTRKRIKDIINSENYKITEATDGEEALEKIENDAPDIVILDLLMPKKTGVEVLKKLKEDNNTIPVIVLSADIQESTKSECLELGVYDFLNKPPAKNDLVNSMKNALELK